MPSAKAHAWRDDIFAAFYIEINKYKVASITLEYL